MSRLHECLTKGTENVKSNPYWAKLYPTVADRMSELYSKETESPRTGTRAKTKKKTARVLGHDFQDTRPWKVRNSGIIGAKSQKAKGQSKIKKMISDKSKGDAKRHEGL